jgi:hypothetical protein
MALNLKLGNAVANAEADAAAALFNNGYLRIYDGAQPAGPDTAITTQVLLAELRFGNPAFPAAVAGVLTANAITSDSSADATGTAAWYRCFKSDGTTALVDGTVGVSGCNLNIASVAVQLGVQVAVSAFQHTVSK